MAVSLPTSVMAVTPRVVGLPRGGSGNRRWFAWFNCQMGDITQRSGMESAPFRRDWVAVVAAGASFGGVMLAGFGVYLADFRVSPNLLRALPWAGVVVFVLVVKLSVPSSRLAPARREQREARTAAVVMGLLTGVLVLSGIAAVGYLNSWSEWLVLGVLSLTAIGVGIMLHIRFTIGPG